MELGQCFVMKIVMVQKNKKIFVFDEMLMETWNFAEIILFHRYDACSRKSKHW